MKNWIKDFLFGPAKYSSVMEEGREVYVSLPGNTYAAKAYRFTDSWKRPFWFIRSKTRIKLELIDKIPAPRGDGEITSISCYGETIEEGIGWWIGNHMKLCLEAERGVIWN